MYIQYVCQIVERIICFLFNLDLLIDSNIKLKLVGEDNLFISSNMFNNKIKIDSPHILKYKVWTFKKKTKVWKIKFF